MEKLNTARTVIDLPNKPEIDLVSFKDYLDKNSFLLQQCEDEDVMFHISFLTISHAIEKAMLFLRWEPDFNRFEKIFEDCDSLIFSYQSEWLTKNGYNDWQEECLKIADDLSPTITGRKRINKAVKIYMDNNFLMDIILSELRQILALSEQERLFIIQEGIPFLKRTIRLSNLNPIELSLFQNKPKFSPS